MCNYEYKGQNSYVCMTIFVNAFVCMCACVYLCVCVRLLRI